MNKRVEIVGGLEESAFWMPFTANRQFKKTPRLLARAQGMHYWTPEGRQILDGTAGLWCTNAGHNRAPIVEAIRAQAAELDYAPAFQFSHPKAFELASRVAARCMSCPVGNAGFPVRVTAACSAARTSSTE